MDQIKEFLTRRNIIALLVIAVLAAGLLVSIRLVQQQTQLKSKAAGIMEPAPAGFYKCGKANQPKIGSVVGRCLEPANASGCYKTAYARYDQKTSEEKGDVDKDGSLTFDKDGDGEVDADAVDQPWCDSSNCTTDYNQCPAAPSTAFTCNSIATSPSSSTQLGNQVTINVGGKTNDDNKMAKIIVYIKPPGQSFSEIGTVSCSDTQCSGSLSWDTGQLNNGAGSYTIAQRLVNNLGGERNSNADDSSCNTPYTLTSPTTVAPSPGGDVGVGALDVGTCNSITIDGQDFKKHPGLVINPQQPYKIKIAMSNSKVGTPQSDWKSGYYLKYTGGSTAQLGLSASTVQVPNPPVSIGESRDFDVTINPTIAGSYQFYWQMYNDQNKPFLEGQSGKCTPDFTIFSTLPGVSPPPTNVCSGSAGFLGGADRVWKCVDESDFTPGCVGGSKDSNRSCSSGLSCYACLPPGVTRQTFPFGQCGRCSNNPKTQAEDPNCENVEAIQDDDNSRCTKKTKIDSKEFKDKCIDTQCIQAARSRDCLVCWGSSCEIDETLCTDPAKPFCQTTGVQRGFCTAGATGGTGFDFSINKPSDFIMTKGQSQVGKEFVVSKTAGSAEDVSFATNGNTGGAVAVFSPSGVCKPDPSTCRRTVTFNIANAEPGDYSITIQGTATGGRIRESDPFNLKINPAGVVVTCFVVSENRNTRNLFKNCAESTIQNVSDGIAGTIEDLPQIADFQLSAQKGNKTLWARFLKLPVGESITTCSADKCKDTQAGITLNVVTPSPPPTPVTGCACQVDNSCSSPCKFTKLTDIEYTDPISCATPTRIHNVVPDSQNKNSYCNRPRRTEGDANADNKIDIDDYLYYLTAVSGGKVPVSVNPDFDGNGDVGPNDLTIWERSKP